MSRTLSRAVGVTRSLTHQFKKIKPRLVSPPLVASSTDKERLLDSTRNVTAVELVSMPPRWVDRYDSVLEDLDNLDSLGNCETVKRLEDLQKKRLSIAAFGDTSTADASIEEISSEIAATAEKCKVGIESLSTFSAREGDVQVLNNAQKATAARLQTLTKACRLSQQLYHTKKLDYSADSHLLDEEEDAIPSEEAEAFTDTVMWKERSQGIDQLLSNFTALSDIFKELNHLVVEQGNILDRIDYNIEMTKDETEKAVKELNKVSRYTGVRTSTIHTSGLLLDFAYCRDRGVSTNPGAKAHIVY